MTKDKAENTASSSTQTMDSAASGNMLSRVFYPAGSLFDLSKFFDSFV